MGDDIAQLNAGQMGRTTGHQLTDNDLPVCLGYAIYADTTEVGGRIRRKGGGERQKSDQ